MSRTNLTSAIRTACWRQNCGKRFEVECFVGCGAKITPFAYECGHIEAVAKGGSNIIDNLKPICSTCNKSMGSTNMIEYIKRCGFEPEWIKESQKDTRIRITGTGLPITVDSLDDRGITGSFRIINHTPIGLSYTYIIDYPNRLDLRAVRAEYINNSMFVQLKEDYVVEADKKIPCTEKLLKQVLSKSDLVREFLAKRLEAKSMSEYFYECACLGNTIVLKSGDITRVFLHHDYEFSVLGYSKEDYIEEFKKHRNIINLGKFIEPKVSEEYEEIF
jgi:hypothetical protein